VSLDALVVGILLICVWVALWHAANCFNELATAVRRLTKKEHRIMADIDSILASVAELTTIGDSLDTLFAQLQALIAQGATDPAKMQQAEDLINAHKERTKAAIVANTPAV
jgi:peptidoglycan hydrolase CwlO-like protein